MRDTELHGAEIVPMMVGDLGPSGRNNVEDVLDLDDYFKKYLPSIQVDGLEIPLMSAKRSDPYGEVDEGCLPLPEELARVLLDRPESSLSKLQAKLQALKAYLGAAPSDEIAAIGEHLSNARREIQ